MIDPFAAGHRAKAVADAKAAEAKAKEAMIERATAKGEAIMKSVPVEKPYVPSKTPWSSQDC